jgi:hypothetical protein
MKRKYYMLLRSHSDKTHLIGKHAVLSPSQYHWINYDEDKMARVFTQAMAAARGDRLHKLAHDLIKEGVKLPRNTKTLNMYVNDAIGFKMTPEQKLYYSDNAFGTADTLSFKNALLRIHDLKTGFTPAKIHQHEVYGALFCLEYDYSPFDIAIEMRIYQNDAVQVFEADPDVIFRIMQKIKFFDKLIDEMKKEALS